LKGKNLHRSHQSITGPICSGVEVLKQFYDGGDADVFADDDGAGG
jgi:hypothetical protein